MANLAHALKGEIQRLARKELRQHLDPLRRQLAQQRKEIAALKKALTVATRSQAPKRTPKAELAETEQDAGRLRFTAKGFRTNRARLGLSAEQIAALLGVSVATIYNWEQDKAAPRRSQLPRIAALRSMGKREVRRLLEELSASSAKSAKA